jgi:hypothetical protein
MNSIRKWVCFLLAMGITVFALPGMAAAPTKTYSLNADARLITYSGNPLSVDVPAPITITIKNESPPTVANSNISSFSFTVAGMVITTVNTSACQNQGGICNLDSSTNTVFVTNISPPVQAQAQFSVPVTVNSCGDATWSAQVWSGSQLNGTMFGFKQDSSLPTNLVTNVDCGDAPCGFPFTVPNTLAVAGSPTFVSGIRGDYNKDGSTCSTVDYTATNTLPTQKLFRFEWDRSEPTATFRYTLNFPAPVMPFLAWLSNTAGFVPIAAQPCLLTQFANNLPAPYGTLAQAVNSNKNKIQVNVTNAPTIPLSFPIIVDSERMQVTALGNNWTVQRGQGGTTASSHAAGAPVMSTPRPLLTGPFDSTQSAAGYVVGNQAHGCIASPDPSLWPSSTYDVIDIDDIITLGR